MDEMDDMIIVGMMMANRGTGFSLPIVTRNERKKGESQGPPSCQTVIYTFPETRFTYSFFSIFWKCIHAHTPTQMHTLFLFSTVRSLIRTCNKMSHQSGILLRVRKRERERERDSDS